ncbi:MAG TPA: hypothetical protein VGH48_06520 [Caldimonas sp.]
MVTVAAEVRILEMLGIVSNPDTVKGMNLTLAVVQPDTPAMMKGLFQLLAGLIRLDNKTTSAHHDSINKRLESLSAVADSVLTFGSFLPICETLMEAKHKKNGHKEVIKGLRTARPHAQAAERPAFKQASRRTRPVGFVPTFALGDCQAAVSVGRPCPPYSRSQSHSSH